MTHCSNNQRSFTDAEIGSLVGTCLIAYSYGNACEEARISWPDHVFQLRLYGRHSMDAN